MGNLLNDIDNLKEKINNEIKSLSYYKELSYICDLLLNEINSFEYDKENILSLKKYKAYLEVFLEQRIAYINNLIVNRKHDSIFDNSDNIYPQKIDELKNNITSLLTYINNIFPVLGEEITSEFKKINDYYIVQLDYTKGSFKRKFNVDIGISNEPILSTYSDTSNVLKCYYHSLDSFKTVYIDKVKIFVDNDIKVKELFKRANETLKDPRAIEAVKSLEFNYTNEINKCMKSGSLYANNNILKIQENMLQNGLQLDEIINREKEKNSYYETISNIDFNYQDIDELLKIEEYVNENKVFKDEFYQVLYALIEKEKYLHIKYGQGLNIYDKISEKSKIILEKIYLDKIALLNDNNREEAIVSLKKNSYIGVLDNDYEEFFNNHNFTLETNYSVEEMMDNDNLELLHIVNSMLVDHYIIKNIKTGKSVDHIFVKISPENVLRNYGDIYKFSGEHYKTNKKIIRYYNKDGKKIKPFKDDDYEIIQKIFNLYLVKTKNGKIIIDLDYNKVFDLDNNKYLAVDNKCGRILTLDMNGYCQLYNDKLNEIKSIDLAKELNEKNLSFWIDETNSIFNDNIIVFYVMDNDDEKYVYYYDVEKMKIVDKFKKYLDHNNSIYGYNNGLYNYTDDSWMMGYKNLNGEIVIPPIFTKTNPFLNGCALVSNNNSKGLIDYQNHFVSFDELFNSSNEFVYVDLLDNRYEIMNFRDNKKYYIKVNSTYSIDLDNKILDIDFNKRKIKKLK